MINGFALRILRFEGVGHVFLGLDPVGPCQRILIFTSRSRAGTRAFRGEVDGMDSIPEALHDVRPETKSQPPIYMRERTRNEKGGGGIRHFRLGARRGDPSRGSRRPSFPRYSSGFPLPLKKSGGFLWDLWTDSVVDGVLVRPCASFSVGNSNAVFSLWGRFMSLVIRWFEMDGFRCCNIYSDKFLSKGKKVDLFFQSAFCNHVSNFLQYAFLPETCFVVGTI